MATSSRKRLYQDIDSFESIQQPLPNASIHGSFTSLSSLKKGKNSHYFDGIITDGTSFLRIVGFSSEQQKKLSAFFESGQPAHLENCEVKKSRQGDKLEVMLKKFTDIQKSPKKITIPPDDGLSDDSAVYITLGELNKVDEFQRVTVDVKVIYIGDPTEVSGGKIKQDVTVADCTDNSRLTIWEDRMNTLDKGASYTLKNIVVRLFRDKKYLSFPRCGLSVIKIPDIGTVEEDGHNSDADKSTTYRLIKACVIAVVLLDSYKSCISCRARVETTEPPLGRCSKCCMMQHMEHCAEQTTAKLIVKEEQGQRLTLSAFGTTLQQICMAGAITQEMLLQSPTIDVLNYNKKNIITGIARY